MNLGKFYPRHIRCDMTYWPYVTNGPAPPRKWLYHSTNGGALGTLAIPWLAQDILSEESEYEDGGLKLSWKCHHPTVTDNYMKIIWGLGEMPPGSFPMEGITFLMEFWHHGTKYGDFGGGPANTAEFLLPDNEILQNISWFHLVDTSKFRSITTSHWRAASWADDPGYQPYHTAP